MPRNGHRGSAPFGPAAAPRAPAAAIAAPTAAAIAAAALAAAMALGGCALDLPAAPSPDAAKQPTARFSGYSHTVVIRGEKGFELRADSAEVYASENRTLLTGVSFTEYDPDTGEILSFGKADLATFHDDTEDAEFSGSVNLESKRQDAALAGEYLSWNSKEKRLEGRLDRTVTLSRQDGSRVTGAGFMADARRRSFSFKESVEGLVVEKEGNAAAESVEAAPSAAAPSGEAPSGEAPSGDAAATP